MQHAAAAASPEDEDMEIPDDEHTALKKKRLPPTPSADDVEAHESAGHVPYRTWCRACVAGRGRSDAHHDAGPSDVPVVGLDYGYLERRDECPEGETPSPILVVKDGSTKAIFGEVLPYKGVGHVHCVRTLVRIVAGLGHPQVVLKSDEEPAIVALKRQAALELRAAHGMTVILEESPVGDSQSNGLAENAVRELKGVARSLKFAVATLHNTEIHAKHPILPWLISHASAVIIRSQLGKDGLTAFRRWKGRDFRRALPPFGEVVLYLPPGKRASRLEERWLVVPAVAGPRRVYIRKGVELLKYGYSVGCPGCDAARSNTAAKPHSEPCRLRLEQAMAADEAGAARVAQAATRRAAQAEPEGEGAPASKRRAVADARMPDAGALAPGVVGDPFTASAAADTSMGSIARELCALGSTVSAGVLTFDEGHSQFDLHPSLLLDLRCGVNLARVLHCDRAEKTQMKTMPAILMGCTLAQGDGRGDLAGRHREAHDHLAILCDLYRRQMTNEKWFLHEHPANAPSWDSHAMRKFRALENIYTVECDLCAFGLQGTDQEGVSFVQKPTRFVTNMKMMAEALDRQCPGGHRHCLGPCRAAEHCEGWDPYPAGLVATVLRSLRWELSVTPP